MKPHIALPDCGKPFAWDLVTVLDPRASDRALQVYLLTRKVPIAIPKHFSRSEGVPAYKQILISPVHPHTKGDDTGPRQHISFTVADPRYPPQVVDMFLTPRQAGLLQHSILSSDKAGPVLTAKDHKLRFKCYVPGCKATSSDKTFLATHFENGIHPGLEFDQDRVVVFRVNGGEDPAVLKTPPPFIILPTAINALESPSNPPSLAGSKRERADDDSATEATSNKALKTDKSTFKINRLVDDYMAKNPATTEVEAEAEDLFCTCLSREDGRLMLRCANDGCRLIQYHLECLGLTGDDLPPAEAPWFCPECIKEAKAGKRPARPSDHTPSIPAPAKFFARPSCMPNYSKPNYSRPRNGGPSNGGPSNSRPSNDKPRAGEPSNVKSSEQVAESSSARKQLSLTLSPSAVDTNPWSAGMVSSFPKQSDNETDYNLTSLASAKAALQARHAQPLGKPVAKPANRPGEEEGHEYSAASYKSPNRLSWTAVEEQHLKDVVKECADAGLSGEALWAAAHPKLTARGVNRPIGGMKMRWCRGLRDQTKIDERRKPNNKLLTALQKPKSAGRPSTSTAAAAATATGAAAAAAKKVAKTKAGGPHDPLKAVEESSTAGDAAEATASSAAATAAPVAPAAAATTASAGRASDLRPLGSPLSANQPATPADLVSWVASKGPKASGRGRRSRSC